jgi:hypothetical protein
VLKTEALFQIALLLNSPDTGNRTRISAIKTLAAMDKLDQADDQLDLARQRLGADYPKDVRTAAEIVLAMNAAAKRYELEHDRGDGDGGGVGPGDSGDSGGTEGMQAGPGPV